jgi:hypothetical protein
MVAGAILCRLFQDCAEAYAAARNGNQLISIVRGGARGPEQSYCWISRGGSSLDREKSRQFGLTAMPIHGQRPRQRVRQIPVRRPLRKERGRETGRRRGI